MKPFNRKRAADELRVESEQVSRADLEALLAKQQKIEAKVKSSGRLARFRTDIELMFALLRDYWRGNYRAVPWKSIAAIAGALLYVLNPIDLIPDIILGFGLMDDAAVVAFCLTMVESDLFRYAAWREHNNNKAQPGH